MTLLSETLAIYQNPETQLTKNLMKTNYSFIRTLNHASILSLFFILPFMPIIKYGVPIGTINDASSLALLKDLFVFIFISTALIITRKSFLKIDSISMIWILLILYAASRAIITQANILDAIDSFRYEFLYSIVFLFYYVLAKKNKIDSEKILSSVLFFFVLQFIVVIFIGYIEFFDKSIRVLLYRDKAYNLVTGFPGVEEVRIVSTLENPINLGLFLSISYIFSCIYLYLRRKFFYTIIFWIFGAPIVFMTFSRTSTVLYTLIGLAVILRSLSKLGGAKNIFIVVPLVIGAIYIIPFVNFGDIIDLNIIEKRVDQSMGVESYINDPRIQQWEIAFKSIDAMPIINNLMGLGLGVSNPAGGENKLAIENSFITIYVQLGLIGYFLCIIFGGFTVTNILKGLLNQGLRDTYFFVVLIYFIFIFAGLANDIHRNLPFSVYFWFLVAHQFLIKNHSASLSRVKSVSCNKDYIDIKSNAQ